MHSCQLTLFIGRCWGHFQYKMNSLASAYANEQLRRKLRSIGPNVELPSTLEVDHAERIKIGDWVYVGPGGSLSGRGGLEIADHVVIGPKVIIMTSMHNYRGAKYIPYDEIELLKPVEVGLACWIGMGAIVMPGVTLGKGCIVGAGSVVTKSFPDGSIVAGNPAKVVGQQDMLLFLDHLAKDRTYLKNWYFKGKPKVEQTTDV